MNWYLAALSKYAQFSGRSRRKEYWMFTLINIIVLILLSLLGGGGSFSSMATGQTPSFGIGSVLYGLYALFVFIPGLAVSVRRLHDTGRSAWWLLIAIIPLIGALVLLVFVCLDGQPGPNQYGPNPKEVGV